MHLEQMIPSFSPSSLADASRADVQPTSTITPYYTDLNGVNSPLDMLCRTILWASLGLVVLIIFCIRMTESIWSRTRLSAAISNTKEDLSSCKVAKTTWSPWFKKHILYAALWNKWHHREVRLGSLNFGALPSRLHVIFFALYLVSNIIYLAAVDVSRPNHYAIYAELRGRSGTLAVANMIPLIVLAGRNNPLIPLLRVSFDTYNLFHRWIGRLAVAEIILHAVFWAIPVVADGGWKLIREKVGGTLFLGSGATGMLAMVLMAILSLSPLRRAFYEVFLDVHILLACVVFTLTWIHCASSDLQGGLPQMPWITAVVSIWIAERLFRAARILYVNVSGTTTSFAFCEALPGNATRVTLHLPRHVLIKPGMHAYLRFWGARAWESHPFSVAWAQHSEPLVVPTQEKQLAGELDRAKFTTSLTFIINARKGMTKSLYQFASKFPRGIRMRAAMEGPYAGYHSLDSYSHAILIAGAGGITHQISYLRPLLEASNAGTIAIQRITLLWVIRDSTSLGWIRPHMNELNLLPNYYDKLSIRVYITNKKGEHDVSDMVFSATFLSGRPNLRQFLAEEVNGQFGAYCVSVCGPGGLADDVRDAVRALNTAAIVDFIAESFTW